jgi:hypothetical protein
MNTKLSDELKNKEADIAAAERLYDQVVASLDAQYGSASSNGDTGVERATRRSAIKTRDAQYYAARDTSWANTLSGSATIGNTPWTLKAIASANAQAAYSTNRARAQAAHDAALLSAMNDWRESSSAAYLKSLVSSSRAENDFKSSVAGFWADWNMATEGNDRGAPTDFLGSVTDSVMGLMNPFDTDSIARSLTTEAKADTTNGPQRPKPSDTFLMQPFPLPMNSLFERRRWEQQITNDPAEANTNTVLIAMTGGGVGHHWVPINVLLTLFEEGFVSLEEVFDFAALTSGALRGGHDYTMVYGGITYSQYDEEVMRVMLEWKSDEKWSNIDRLTLTKMIRDGKNLDGTENPILKAFNSAVESDQVYSRRTKKDKEYMEGTPEERRTRGQMLIKKRGWTLAVIGFIAGVMDKTDSVANAANIGDVIANGPGMKEAIKAAEKGDREKLKAILTSPGPGVLAPQTIPFDLLSVDPQASAYFRLGAELAIQLADLQMELFEKESASKPLDYKRPQSFWKNFFR